MLGLKLIHISKKGLSLLQILLQISICKSIQNFVITLIFLFFNPNVCVAIDRKIYI